MAIQQTMSSKDGHLSEQTFGLLVILTGHINKEPEKKNLHSITFQGDKHPFTLCFSLLG